MLLASVSLAQAQPAWGEKFFNPKPQPDDVVLPMPCGGAMAFRRVLVPSTGVLDDRRVQLGSSDPRFAYAENSRNDYVAGGFTDAKAKGQRYYLMGKYEVTEAQYQAVTTGQCVAPTNETRKPKVEVTWIDAVVFSGRYSTWLATKAANRLPTERSVPGFVRLPTEAEWEFAARGGIAVDNATFEQPLFHMQGGEAKDYAWFGGAQSSQNELNQIGLLRPNPLGLYDMLGNASEFVLDLFHLNKHSHQHGQAGGFLIKGGDFRTELASLRVATREEYIPVDKDGERRSGATGFRVALVAPVLPNWQSVREAQQAWASAAQSSPDAPAKPAGKPPEAAASGGGPISSRPVSDDPVVELDALRKLMPDPALQQRMAALGTAVKANTQARNEQRDRAAKAQLQVGVFLARVVARDAQRVEVFRAQAGMDASTVASWEAIVNDNLLYLMDVVRQLTNDFPVGSVDQQGETLKREFEARNRASTVPAIKLVVDYVRKARNGQAIDKAALRNDLIRLKVS